MREATWKNSTVLQGDVPTAVQALEAEVADDIPIDIKQFGAAAVALTFERVRESAR